MWKTKLIFFLLIWVTLPAFSLSIKHLGVEEGLSNNYILDITQDGQGCIWIATESGLNKFDGHNFTTFTTKNSDLVANELNALLYDEEQNTLWIGTQREGISRLNLTTLEFSNLTINEGLPTNDVTGFSQAADGGIWITHYHMGVTHYNKSTGQLTLYADKDMEGMKSRNWCSLDDGKGNLYVGHAVDGLTIIDIHHKTARNFMPDPQNPHSIPGNAVRAICIDRYNNIWLGTNRGLALFDPNAETFVTFKHEPGNPRSLGSSDIFSIREMKDGTLWIGTDMAGISILNLNNLTLRDPGQIVFDHIHATGNRNSLASANVKCLFQDSFENIWIGSRQKGVDFISKIQPVFQTLNLRPDAADNQIWSMYMDAREQLWVGGDKELSVYAAGKLKRKVDVAPHLSHLHRYISLIKGDSKGNIWVGVYRAGLLRVDARDYRVEAIPTTLLNTMNVRDVFEDKNGKVWIATEAGLYAYHNNQYKYEEKINAALEDKAIYSLAQDDRGNLWVGTFGRGIHIFNEKEELTATLSIWTGFCSNAINHLYKDSNGGIWAATGNGLAHMPDTDTPSRFTVYNDSQEIENAHIRAVCEDASGNIWVSTNAGVSLWNKQKNRFDNFNHKDGVPVGDFMNGEAYATPSGTLFFASLGGICYFNPRQLAEDYEVDAVKIISCYAYNKNIENQSGERVIPSEDGNINLPHNLNSFRISFAVPNYSQSDVVEYAYIMDGLESTWYNTEGENQVTFRNIPPGNYTFKVKARLKNHDWDESSIAPLPVRVHPPLWLTWYAKLIYALVLCAIGYLTIRSYKNRLDLKTSLELEKRNSRNKQELNEERLHFYTNITHELRTPLTLILGPLEDLVADVNLPPVFKKRVETIHGSALRLLNLVNQILEFRKTETQNRQLIISKGDLGSLVTETGLRYKELNPNPKVTFRIAIETEETLLYYDADMVATILNNLLSNALKYTPEGEIRLIMRSAQTNEEKYTEIEVSDTGYGIDPDALPHIFDRYYQAKSKHQASGTGIGLALVKSLTELHEGDLRVSSAPGKGTCFVLRLLTENTYPYALHATDKRIPSASIAEPEEAKEPEEENEGLPIVLVVEDNADIREYIATSLAGAYQVITAANGREGLSLALQHIPNIIISDIMMPEMDGIELCARAKKDIRTSHIPVILLTAKDSLQDREEGYESGADSYLTKPFSAKLLRSRMLNLLESRKRIASQIIPRPAGRKPAKTTEELPEMSMSKIDKEFLDTLTKIIEEHADLSTLDVAFLREKMTMSGSTFYRKVKGLTNLSPNEFLRKIKIKKSAELLLSGKHNISEVAYIIGFSEVSYFRACFKEEHGMTPTEFLRING